VLHTRNMQACLKSMSSLKMVETYIIVLGSVLKILVIELTQMHLGTCK